MATHKKDFDPDCFGTINKETKDICNHCAYSEECEEFKEPLANYIAVAAEKGKANYLHEKAEVRSTAIGKFIGYGLTLLILLFVFWQISTGT